MSNRWLPHIIVVLEDSEPRVQWLKDKFPQADVRWCLTVKSFITQLDALAAQRDEVCLILLDHDLGGDGTDFGGGVAFGTWPKDPDGLDGSAAVNLMDPEWRSVPVVIWSWNHPAAQKMAQTLSVAGFTCVPMPFSQTSLKLVEIITSVLS